LAVDIIFINAVKSDALKWLPNGSELIADGAKPNADAKPKTFTSFSSEKDKLPKFTKNPPAPNNLDIILAKLGPGQVILLTPLSLLYFFPMNTLHCVLW
jgi:DNA-directed RNA polymerase I and III subunit RPAC1